jgi:hypothetical protein
MGKHLTPVQVAERLFGGIEAASLKAGLHRKSLYPCRYASGWHDAGDLRSMRAARLLLAHSAARDLGLTAEHLIWGAPEAEIDAILAHRAFGQPQVAAQ